MKWKIVSFTAIMLVATSQVNAGWLRQEHLGCEGGYNAYAITWGGNWSESFIFMQNKPTWTIFWDFYNGFLDPVGKFFPNPINKDYRMRAQPAGGSPFTDSNVTRIPRITCQPVT